MDGANGGGTEEEATSLGRSAAEEATINGTDQEEAKKERDGQEEEAEFDPFPIRPDDWCAYDRCHKLPETPGSVLKKCMGCQMVKYCSEKCQKMDRMKHEVECEMLNEAREGKLFNRPPDMPECVLCFVMMPRNNSEQGYHVCCGKVVCGGCHFANSKSIFTKNQKIAKDIRREEGRDPRPEELRKETCPFCRTPTCCNDAEAVPRYEARAEVSKDPIAMQKLGMWYKEGKRGFKVDNTSAVSWMTRSSELGNAGAQTTLGHWYHGGLAGLERAVEKAMQYYRMAASAGCPQAHHNLAALLYEQHLFTIAKRHLEMAAALGVGNSFAALQDWAKAELIPKSTYRRALSAHQQYLESVETEQRKAAKDCRKKRFVSN